MQQFKWCILYFNIKTSLALKSLLFCWRGSLAAFSAIQLLFSPSGPSQDTVGFGIHPKYVLTVEDAPSYIGGSGYFLSLWLVASFIGFSFPYMSLLN